MAFVVAPHQNLPVPDTDPQQYALKWPVVFEDATDGGVSAPVNWGTSRESAQTCADAINTANTAT